MEETRGAPSAGWRVRITNQLDDGRAVGPEAERRAIVVALVVVEEPQADRALVELALPIEVRDGEAHGARMRLRGDGHPPKPSSRSCRVRPDLLRALRYYVPFRPTEHGKSVRIGAKGSDSPCR